MYLNTSICIYSMQGETAHFNDDSCDEPNRSFEKVMASFCLGFCAVLPVALPVERGKKEKKKIESFACQPEFSTDESSALLKYSSSLLFMYVCVCAYWCVVSVCMYVCTCVRRTYLSVCV